MPAASALRAAGEVSLQLDTAETWSAHGSSDTLVVTVFENGMLDGGEVFTWFIWNGETWDISMSA